MTRLLVTLFGLIYVLSGCAGPYANGELGHESLGYNGSTYVVFFGRSVEAGWGEPEKGEVGFVSDAQWTAFENAAIAPRLDGYTVLGGLGGYTLPGSVSSDQSLIHEHTKVLIYVVGGGADGNVIKGIAERYKDQFHQHSVLVVRLPSEVTLVD